MKFTLKRNLLAATVGLALGTMPLLASAQEHHDEHREEHHEEHRDDHFRHEFHVHDFAHFSALDREIWLGGHWHNEWHNGRFGWWWFAGGSWYFYDAPVYPYPTVVSEVTYVEPVAAPPPGAAPTYYWCDNPRGYYPYVQNCGMPWRPVPAAPPPANAAPPGAATPPANMPPPPPPQ